MKKLTKILLIFAMITAQMSHAETSELRVVSIENPAYDYTVRVTSDGTNMKVEKCDDAGVCQQVGVTITEEQFRDASATLSYHRNAAMIGFQGGYILTSAALVGCVLAKGRCAQAVSKLSGDQKTLLVAGAFYGGAIAGGAAGALLNDNELADATTGDIWLALRPAEGQKVDEENFNVLLETETSLDRVLESYSVVLMLSQARK